jgi:hypothetical protein
MHKNKIFGLFKDQSGQALLIIVLVLVVALLIGLSVVSRSIINLKNTQDQASSQRALSAAEAGVEAVIKNQASIKDGSFSGEGLNTTYDAVISTISGATPFIIGGNNNQINLVKKRTPAYIWTSDYSASNPFATSWSGVLTISWGDYGDPCKDAALEISVISGDRTSPTLQRFAYDPCSVVKGGAINRASSNNFDNNVSMGSAFNNPKLNFNVALPSINNIYLVSVNPLYADTHIGVSAQNSVPNQNLADQGADIQSTGTDNNVQRKDFVFQGFPQIPAELFPYTIFSPAQ